MTSEHTENKADPAHGFLDEAASTLKARAQLRDAGAGERSMARTVAVFNAWTGNSISENDGWRFMVALKLAREVQGKYNRDDYVDLSAYASLLGECESTSRPHPAAFVDAPLPVSISPFPPLPLVIGPGRLPPQTEESEDNLVQLQRIARDIVLKGNQNNERVLYGTAYELQGSNVQQVQNYDGSTGVPFGALSLGSALNEE